MSTGEIVIRFDKSMIPEVYVDGERRHAWVDAVFADVPAPALTVEKITVDLDAAATSEERL